MARASDATMRPFTRRCMGCSSLCWRKSWDRRDGWWLPGAVENRRVGPVGADIEGERAIGRGQPVALPDLAGRLGADVESERAVRIGLEAPALGPQRVAIQRIGMEEV